LISTHGGIPIAAADCSAGKPDNLTKSWSRDKHGGHPLPGPAKEDTAGKKREPVKPKFLLGEPLPERSSRGLQGEEIADNKVPEKPLFSAKIKSRMSITVVITDFFARASRIADGCSNGGADGSIRSTHERIEQTDSPELLES